MHCRPRFVLLALFLFVALPVHSAVHVWTGAASERFSDALNWSGGSPAGDADASLSFPAGAGRLSVTNDLPALTARAIIFSGAGYIISGNAVTLAPNAEVSDSTLGPNDIRADVVLTGSVTFFSAAGLYDDATLAVSGAISGVGPVTKLGSGRTTFAGTRPNSWSGGTQVLNGELRLGKSDGVAAVAGPLTLGITGVNYEYGYLTTVANEQIPDSATIHVGSSSVFGIGGVETIGPLEVESGASISTGIAFSGLIYSSGTLILAGDILAIGRGSNGTQFTADTALSGIRTLTCDACGSMFFFGVREATPGSGLIIRGSLSSGSIQLSGSYNGPTTIDGPAVSINNPRTAVRLRGGSFKGTVASLVADGGVVDAKSAVVVAGDFRVGAAATVRFAASPGVSTTLRVGGVFDVASASLDFDGLSLPRLTGTKYVIALNNGPAPIRGTFFNVPEGTLIGDRFRVSYAGGDGNDVSVTEGGRFPTGVQLSADPSSVGAAQAVTLVARVSVNGAPSRIATGTVTFREGQTVVGTAPVDAIGNATLVLHPSAGRHFYTASFAGPADLVPSETSFNANVNVAQPIPTVTSVEPASITSGTTAELIVRGTNFAAGGTIVISSTGLAATFVSSTEVRATWNNPRFDQDLTLQLSYSQPDGIHSNEVPLLVKGSPLPRTELRFEPKAIVGPVIAGGGAAWLSVARARRVNGVIIEHRMEVTPDTNRDGLARWEQTDTVPDSGLWLMTDTSDGTIKAGRPNGDAPPATPFPKGLILRDETGHYSHIILPSGSFWDFVWTRPGVGSWATFGVEGGSADEDESLNGIWVFNTSRLKAASSTSGATPAGLEPGDVFVGMSESTDVWIGDRVDAHLRESDGPGTVRIATSIAVVTAGEKSGVARIKLLRTGGSDGTVSVNYATANGTAIAGTHYVGSAGTVTFGPGEIVKTIEVPLIDDDVYSATTTFSVVLSNPAGTTIDGRTNVDVLLVDDDPVPQLSVSDNVSVPEGDDGEVEAALTVTLTGSTRVPVTAHWQFTSTSFGVTPAIGTLTFTPGGPTSQAISAHVRGNRTPEPDRIYNVSITSVVNALPASISRTATIVDDDFAEITILDATVSEAQDRVTVIIATTVGSQKPVTVNYATASGSAVEGSDFRATTGTAAFDRTTGRQLVTIPIVADSIAEGTESFTLVLSDAKNGTIRRGSATIVIVDDDSAALPSISAGPVVITDSYTVASFRFRLSFPSSQEVRFRVVGSDPVLNQVVTIPAGANEATLRVPVRTGLREFALTLSEPVGATIATPTVMGKVLSDALPDPGPNAATILVSDISVVEGSAGLTTARFTVQLASAVSSPVTVAWATADGTATAPADYIAASGALTFAPGETAKSVDVAVMADRQFEFDERFTLVLGNATNARIGNSAASCRVINDDAAPVDRRRTTGH